MPTFTQKYTLVQLLQDVAEGSEYAWTEWPLHVTIADIFAIDWSVSTTIQRLERVLADRQPFTAIATGEYHLGDDHVPVVLIEPTSELMQLHLDVIDLLEQGGARFNTPQYIKKGWLPHSTIQHSRGLHAGDTVTFDALTLIDMFPSQNGYRRKIIKTLPFKT